MKKLLAVVVVLVLLVGGAVFALPHLVPMERIEQEVTTRFTAATGRTLSYGSVRLNFWPNVGLRLKDVKVSNPDWAKSDNMLTLGEMDVSLSARALLDKKVDVKKFILRQPVINLETAADGRVSWEMKPTGEVKAAVDAPAGTAAKQDGMTASDFDVTLGEVSISDGEVSFLDGKTGKVEKVSDVDISIVMPNLQAALNIDGSMLLRDKKVSVVLSVDKPFDLVNGKPSPGSLNVQADMLKADVAGTLATTGTMLKGRINADVSSLPALVAWLGQGEQKPMPVNSISVASTAEISATNVALSGATVKVDDMQGSGDLGVKTDGVRPMVKARLTLDKVDLDRFIAGDASKADKVDDKAKPVAESAGWDNTPIDFSGLKSVDADVVIDAKGFKVKGVDVGASTLTAKLNNGKLDFSTTEAALFGGTAKAVIGVNASGATPSISAKVNLANVQAKPVLTTFAGFDKLSGTTEANLDITASGASQQAMMSTLGGSGKVVFRNGAIEGIDIVNLAKAIQSKLGEMGVGGGKTDFVEMGGSFTIAKGIATNSDLALRGPLVQASGKGTVDLPKKHVNYRVEPVLTASSGVEGAGGIRVPVDIVGPFSNLKIRPDYAAVIQDVLKDPKKMKENLKQIEDSFDPLKDNVKNLRKDIKEDPAKAIGGLLGGGVGGLLAPKPQAAPTPAPVAAPADTTVAPAQPADAPAEAPVDPSNPAAEPAQ